MKGIARWMLMAGAGGVAFGLMGISVRADVIIYQGQPAQSAGLKMQSWGSGEAKDTEEYVFTGVRSIKVKTHGRYQGARLVLDKPASVKDALTDPRVYLELAVLVPERQTTGGLRSGAGGMLGPGGMMGSGGMLGPGGGMIGPGGGRRGGTGSSGGMLGPGGGMTGPGGGMTGPGAGRGTTGPSGGRGGTTGPGRGGSSGGMLGPGGGRGGLGGDSSGGMGPGGSGTSDAARSLLTEPKPIRQVRAVLVMTDGKQIDVTLPMEFSKPTREGWRTLAVPFAYIPALKNTSAEIAEVRLFGDSVGTMYVGQIRTIQDETPIRVEDIPERTVAVNDTVKFTGSAEAGISQLKYEWTVLKAGERPDPLPVDAEGRTFEHKFRKSGEYDVVLTVRDVYGRKQPATTVAKVRVTM